MAANNNINNNCNNNNSSCSSSNNSRHMTNGLAVAADRAQNLTEDGL